MKTGQANRKNEKGAALVMVLMMAALLLTGCIALLAGASLLTANVTDAVAEQQAYNAAESGIQTAINVLRRNNSPNPLLDPTQSETHSNNKIDYARAVNLSTSNLPGDPSTEARLSRWINYNYTPPGATAPDRSTLGEGVYTPETGSAFSVTVRDPDNPTSIINLTTSASIDGGGSYKDFGIPAVNSARIQYNSATTGNVNVNTREVGVNLGSFTISKYNFLNSNSTAISDTPFTITVRMTAPLPAVVKLRGTIKAGSISGNSIGTVKIVFDSPVSSILGSIITLPTLGTITPNAPSVNGGRTDLSVTVTLTLPRRLVIRSVGYGPRGARKVFEAIVKRDNFDGIIPATVTLVGSLTNSLFKSSANSSQDVTYSGSDSGSIAKIPPIGIVGGTGGGGGLLSSLLGNLTGSLCVACTVTGNPTEVSVDETPEFLKSAANLDEVIKEYRETAKATGRYYTTDNPPPDFGDVFNGTGLTFVDGNALLGKPNGDKIYGGGILIVTGKLTLGGAVDFKGTILATGEEGVRKVNNGGHSTIDGNLVVAPYRIGDTAAGFLSPKYDITGGLASTLVYNASNLLFGSDNFNTVVVSVGEK